MIVAVRMYRWAYESPLVAQKIFQGQQCAIGVITLKRGVDLLLDGESMIHHLTKGESIVIGNTIGEGQRGLPSSFCFKIYGWANLKLEII
jgi:hypothetical protein